MSESESFTISIAELSKKKMIAICPSCGEAMEWNIPLCMCKNCCWMGLHREMKEIRPKCLHDILKLLELEARK